MHIYSLTYICMCVCVHQNKKHHVTNYKFDEEHKNFYRFVRVQALLVKTFINVFELIGKRDYL